jgi:hypothetical protein
MLRACAIQYGQGWNKSLPYAEFSFNDSYQESLKMAPFEMLYGRRCWTLLLWNETGELMFLDPTYPKMPRDKFVSRERTYRLHSQGRRVMPTLDEENCVLKLEIIYTSRCRLWEVYGVSWYEPSSHLGSLVQSRSQRREKKNWKHNFFSDPSKSRGRDSF